MKKWITTNPRDAAHTGFAVVSLSLIGAGLWVELRAWAFVVIGTLLLAGVVYARVIVGPPDDSNPQNEMQ